MIRALVVASIRYLLARRSRLMAAFQRKEGMEVGEYARKETQKKIPLGFPRQAFNSEYIYIAKGRTTKRERYTKVNIPV